VLSLVLVVLLVWFVATVLLAAWTLFFQGYIYTEPVADVWWRAPAAGTAITLLLLLWVICDYRAPGRYRELQEFSAAEDRKPFTELHIINSDGKEEVYKQVGKSAYLLNGEPGGRGMPSGPRSNVIAIDGEHRYVFEPVQRDAQGHYNLGRGESLRYRNAEKGWEMTEGMLGKVSSSRPGLVLANLLLNLLHLLVWFVCLWLLLHYQWPHALGLAVVFWLVTTLLVLPQVLALAETVAKQRGVVTQSRPRPTTMIGERRES
jgi:hypothetical protein